MTTTITPLDDRDVCAQCPSSKEGCQARKLFSGSRCCSRCSHGPRSKPAVAPAGPAA